MTRACPSCPRVETQRVLVSEEVEAGGGRSLVAISGLCTQRGPILGIYEYLNDQIKEITNVGVKAQLWVLKTLEPKTM